MKKSIVLATLLVPMLALAQPNTADDWYKEGETQYNLGNFEKAAEAFKQGFSLEENDSKKPAYLYNVAQAYRQSNKCKDAAFFYKRYLSLKDQDAVKPLKPEKRAEIEQRITELEECARTQDSIAKKPPDNTMRPDGSTTGVKPKTGGTPKTGTTPKTGGGATTTTGGATTGGTAPTGKTVGQVEGGGGEGGGGGGEGEGEGEGDGGNEGVTGSYMVTPHTINARFVGGLSKIAAGDVDTQLNTAFALTAGYPVVTQMDGKLVVDAGVTLGFTPLPYKNNISGETKNASLTSLLANGAATYMVTPKIGVRGDLGLGVLLFGGIEEMGSPFTVNANATTGTLTMFALRVAASVDYALTPNIALTATPLAFSFSPAKEGLVMSSLIRLDFMLGIGYRM